MGIDKELLVLYNGYFILSKLTVAVLMKVQTVKAFWKGHLSPPMKNEKWDGRRCIIISVSLQFLFRLSVDGHKTNNRHPGDSAEELKAIYCNRNASRVLILFMKLVAFHQITLPYFQSVSTEYSLIKQACLIINHIWPYLIVSIRRLHFQCPLENLWLWH